MKSLFGSAETTDVVVKEDHADINIFTVASGLLYEVRNFPLECVGSANILPFGLAFRWNYDPERNAQYKKYRQVLVH